MSTPALSEAFPGPIGLIAPLPPPNGGMAMQALQLRRLLEQEGAQVDMLATNAAYRPTWIARLPGLRAVFRLVPYVFACWRLLGRCRVVHLMANSGWSWHLFAAPVLILAPWRSTPVIVNYRGGEAHAFFERSFRWVNPVMRRAASIVVPSGYLQQVFREFGLDTLVVPNIIDLDLFGAARASDGQGDGHDKPFVFVITRNLERIYGIDVAIRALAVLRERGLEVELEIAGSGPEERALAALATELQVHDAVRFLGRLNREEVAALYRRADAALNPTTVDNMPNSVIEALASAVPVISSDVGGVPYIVTHEESALLVPVGDVNELASAMQRLLQSPELRTHLTAAGLESVKAYAWPVVRDQWRQMYVNVTERSQKDAN